MSDHNSFFDLVTVIAMVMCVVYTARGVKHLGDIARHLRRIANRREYD